MNRALFFATLRKHFGGKFSAPQVAGIEALLDEGRDLPLHHMANVLAQVRRETGGHMAPIKETVMPGHKDKNPSDETVKARLEKAYKAGKLPWVKTPYWRDGWFGRGQLQVTHERNYRKFGITDPNKMLDMATSARVAVEGMVRGLFTGKRLADFDFPAALDDPPGMNPRRIVNGKDDSDAEVAKFHRQFASALEAAGWGTTPPVMPDAPQPEPEKASGGILAILARIIAAIFGGKK